MNKTMNVNRHMLMSTEEQAPNKVRRHVRNFLYSITGAADPDLYYFTLNGMIMPLRRKI